MSNKHLNIEFLGTGTSQGIPIIGGNHPVNFSQNPKDKRLRTSALISKGNKNIVIDCGPDFRQQMLRANVHTLDAILLTHEHNDHVLGLDDTRPFIHIAQKPMDIYAQKRVLGEIRSRFPYAFAEEKYPGAPSFNENIIDEQPFEVAGFHVQPLEIMHGTLPIHGFLIDEKIAYITDASFISDKVIERIHGVEVLILNALRKERPHCSHFILNQALETVDRISPKKAYFTHISVEMGFHDETQAELPANVFLAYDELKIEI